MRDGLREATGGDGVDVIIDPVGGPLAERALRAGRWGGRFVTVGYASGEIPRIPLNLVLLKGVAIVGFEMRTFGLNAPEDAARDRRELMDLFAAGQAAPPHRRPCSRSTTPPPPSATSPTARPSARSSSNPDVPARQSADRRHVDRANARLIRCALEDDPRSERLLSRS